MGDELRPAGRGQPATGPRRHHDGLADLGADGLPLLVHRRALEEGPRIEIEIVLRIQRLAKPPEASALLAVLPEQSPLIGVESLERTGPTIETIYGNDLTEAEYAIEVSYEGSYELDEDTLKDGSVLDLHFGAMGGWISSTLVRLGDLKFEFLPPDPDEED